VYTELICNIGLTVIDIYQRHLRNAATIRWEICHVHIDNFQSYQPTSQIHSLKLEKRNIHFTCTTSSGLNSVTIGLPNVQNVFFSFT